MKKNFILKSFALAILGLSTYISAPQASAAMGFTSEYLCGDYIYIHNPGRGETISRRLPQMRLSDQVRAIKRYQNDESYSRRENIIASTDHWDFSVRNGVPPVAANRRFEPVIWRRGTRMYLVVVDQYYQCSYVRNL